MVSLETTPDSHNEENSMNVECDTVSPTLTPIPNEILAEIFLHTVHYHPPHLELKTVDSSSVLTTDYFTVYTPWIIGHVCHQWREVVLNMPTLWNYIWIMIQNQCVDDPDQESEPLARNRTVQEIQSSSKRHIQLVKALLPETGSVGLHIQAPNKPASFWPPADLYDVDIALVRQLIPIYGHRLSDLSLYVSYEAVLELTKLDATLLNSIKTLHLQFLDYQLCPRGFFEQMRSSALFLNTKALKTLYIGRAMGHLLPTSLLQFSVQWSQIQKLALFLGANIRDGSEDVDQDILKILGDCHHLTYLRIEGSFKFFSLPENAAVHLSQPIHLSPTILLSKLQTLIVHSDAPLLHAITAPMLQTLKIHSRCHDARACVVAFLHRSAPPLKVYDDQSDLGPRELPSASKTRWQIPTLQELADVLFTVQTLRSGYLFNVRDFLDLLLGKIFPSVTFLQCQVGGISRSTELLSICEHAFEERVTNFRHRTIRTFTHCLAIIKDPPEDNSAFNDRADELFRRTGIKLVHEFRSIMPFDDEQRGGSHRGFAPVGNSPYRPLNFAHS